MRSFPTPGGVAVPPIRILALTGLLAAVAGCRPPPAPSGPRGVTITASEYAFQIPDSLRAGATAFRLQNAGKVPHEVAMALLKPGATLAQVLDLVKATGKPDSLLDGMVGVLIANPGVTTGSALLVDLLPGRTYAFVCSFRDGPDKPPHLTLGMVASRTISAAP